MSWWRHVISLELRKILAYRTDFWVTFLGQALIQMVIATSLWAAIFAHQKTGTMNGYTLPMLTLYYLLVPIGNRILTGENIGFLSREIYDGTFNRYLIYPLSWIQYKTCTYLTYSLFYSSQLILLYFIYVFSFGDGASVSSVVNLLCGVGLFLFSAGIYLLMSMAIELLSLWADNIWSLMVMFRFFTNFLGGGSIPLAFFPAWSRDLLAWTPFPYLVSLPVRTIMGETGWHEIAHGLVALSLWGFIFLSIVQLLWKRGQKSYSGVGI